MAADDEAEPTMRGLPDPSQRAWRHPSEMNGAANAGTTAAAPVDRFATSLLSKGLFSVVVLLVAAATTFQLAGSGELGPAEDVAGPADDGQSPPDEGATAEYSAQATSAQVLPDLTPTRPDAFAEQRSVQQGSLFVTADDDNPVASVVIVGGVMVTSASAVEAYSELWLEGAGRRVAVDVDVIGVDRFADIAVLSSPDSAASISGSSSLLVDELAALPQFDLGDVEKVMVGDTASSSTTKNGAVIGLDEPISHYSGHTIYSAIITSIPFEDHLAGAPLTTQSGDLVGFVMNAAGAVVAALPVDDVVRLARSLLALDGSADPRFALDLSTDAGGRAVVSEVDPDGPFAETLANGDVVVAVDGVELLNADHLTHLIRRLDPGGSVIFTVERADRRFDATLALDNPHLAVNPASKP